MDVLDDLDRKIAAAKATLNSELGDQAACAARSEAFKGKLDDRSFAKYQREHWLGLDLKNRVRFAELRLESLERIRNELLDADQD